MNIQAIMKQAQQMQQDVLKAKQQIDAMEFEGKSALVTIKVNGAKKVLSVKIEQDNEIKEDLSILEDMIVIALNDALRQIDKVTEEKMGKYSKAMPGLF